MICLSIANFTINMIPIIYGVLLNLIRRYKRKLHMEKWQHQKDMRVLKMKAEAANQRVDVAIHHVRIVEARNAID